MKIFNKIALLFIILAYSNTVYAFTPSPQFGFNPPINVPNSSLVRSSSPTIIDINNDGVPDIIFGDANGKVHVYSGNGTLLWQHSTGNVAIEAKPAVADMDGDGDLEIIISAGSTFSPINSIGSVSILSHTGSEICRYEPSQFSNASRGVFGSVAIANLDKSDPELEFAFGDWGAKVSVLNHDCSFVWQSQSPPAIIGGPLPIGYDETVEPFTVYVNDTVWSSPAIADINNDGQLDVIIGVDAHVDDRGFTPNGGRLLVINGHNGTLQFAIDTDEVIWSEPAIVDLDNDGSLDIVVGTGYCWQSAACAPGGNVHAVNDKLYAWNSTGQNLPGWPHILGNNLSVLTSSPAIADIDNDGNLDVIINVFDSQSPQLSEGKVLAISHTGVRKWTSIPTVPADQTTFVHFAASASSPIVADITGDGEVNVVVPSNWELIVYDKNGAQLTRTDPNAGPDEMLLTGVYPVSNTPSIADLDGDGDFELVMVSSNAAMNPLPATIYVWDLVSPTSEFLPWGSLRNGVRNNGVYKSNEIFANGFE